MQVVRLAVVTLAAAALLAAGDGATEPSRPTRSQRSSLPCATRTRRRRPARAGVRCGRRCAPDRAPEPEDGRRSVYATGFDEPTGLAADARRALRRGLPRRPRPARRRRRARDDARPPAAGDRRRGVALRSGLRGDDERRRSHASRPRADRARYRSPAASTGRTESSFDRAGDILVAEDSRRVRRIDPGTGRAELVADGVETNKIAVARDGTLFLAGGEPRRAAPSDDSRRNGSRPSCSTTSTSATSPSCRTAT